MHACMIRRAAQSQVSLPHRRLGSAGELRHRQAACRRRVYSHAVSLLGKRRPGMGASGDLSPFSLGERAPLPGDRHGSRWHRRRRRRCFPLERPPLGAKRGRRPRWLLGRLQRGRPPNLSTSLLREEGHYRQPPRAPALGLPRATNCAHVAHLLLFDCRPASRTGRRAAWERSRHRVADRCRVAGGGSGAGVVRQRVGCCGCSARCSPGVRELHLQRFQLDLVTT